MVLWATPLWAQSVDDAAQRDAQAQQRARERQEQLQRQQPQAPDVFLSPQQSPEPTPAPAKPDAPTSDAPAPDEPCFPIERVSVEGQLPEFDWLLPVLSPATALGQCLSASAIGQRLKTAQDALVARGYVTSRVFAQPQDLSKGELAFTLLPGRISAIRFVEGPPERATWRNALPAQEGDILNLRDIEQALENFQRLPSVQADIQIMPGAEPGQSELHIRWQQSLPLRANLSLDDAGSQSTGRYQANASFSYDHWWTLNDMFYLTLGQDAGGGQPGARGTRNASVHYSVPWGYWLLSLNASQSRYFQSVAGATTDYRYSGTSGQQDISLARVVHRNDSGKTTLGLKAFARQSRNFIDDTEVEVQRRRIGGWALSLEHRQQFGANQLELQATYKRGTGAFDAQAAPEELFGEGTSRFALLSLEAGWTQPFKLGTLPVQWSSRWRGQINETALTPQDRFAIGGRYSVRGFDGESSLSAERGWTWRNELSLPLGQSGQQLYAGLDQGWVGGASAQYLMGQRLAGVVLGLRGGFGQVRYDVFVGKPVRKPLNFVTAKTTAGFQLSVNF